ncbi:MAG: response regulator [Polaromonas sp.]|nr:response regulator [Polaromonas sp.]
MRLKAYIIEDNAATRTNLIDTLEELACIDAIGIAETESEAKTWLLENPNKWDIAIIDLFLKQGSGLGVLSACSSRTASQKIVVLTNYATPEIRRRCKELGVDEVFDKSHEIEALVTYCKDRFGGFDPRTAGWKRLGT